MLCEISELKMKVEEDKGMIKEDKRLLANRLEEKSSDVQKLTNTQLDLMNQLILANQELNKKDIKITTLKSQNDLLQNELKEKRNSLKGLISLVKP